MNIILRQPLAFSEIGHKDNQEDALYPSPDQVSDKQRVFLMCDGMGGHEHGEVASNTVAEVLGSTLEAATEENVVDAFQMALDAAYDALDAKDEGTDGKKMGTTLTCVYFHNEGVLIAHIGDSRVYHIRPSLFSAKEGVKGILHQTSDHSLVNDLLKAGELTEEEAKNYPQKNIITKAIQPNTGKRYNAELYNDTDIKKGDYFFLCCDGVLEQLTNQRLCEILADHKLNDKQKLSAIKAECDDKTQDNYTCWLIPVDKVSGDITPDNSSDDIIKADEDSELIVLSEEDNKTVSVKEKNRSFSMVIAVIISLFVIVVSYYTCCYNSEDLISDEENPANTIESLRLDTDSIGL